MSRTDHATEARARLTQADSDVSENFPATTGEHPDYEWQMRLRRQDGSGWSPWRSLSETQIREAMAVEIERYAEDPDTDDGGMGPDFYSGLYRAAHIVRGEQS